MVVLMKVYTVLDHAANMQVSFQLLCGATRNIGVVIAIWAPIVLIRTLGMLRSRFDSIHLAFSDCLVPSTKGKSKRHRMGSLNLCFHKFLDYHSGDMETVIVADIPKGKLFKSSIDGSEWKDLDGHLDSTEKCLEGCVTELESREKNLESIYELVIESNEELDLIRKSIESRVQELESKEKSFHSFQQE
ncbi:hypothetical protein LOK49_LG01G01368 [Camellia lanceoleosa]|uniref:Uncharacterized protein n=1 Tax=Camellia lanceoleosa TaxID=1840588 RepID=A0ACC0J6J9_9ERIC|nr:hypothetical protein LOK49_LG01G01368 [Camellia lanceoleosa]